MSDPASTWSFAKVWALLKPWLGGAVGLATFVYLLWPNADLWQEPDARVSCNLRALDGQTPILLGSYRAPVDFIRFKGKLTDPFKGTLYDLDGEATYRVSGKLMTAEIDGSMFLDEDKQAQGVIVHVRDTNFGPDGLMVATLNDDGFLDYDKEQAFIWVSKDFKLSHPMKLACKTQYLADQSSNLS